MAVGLVRHAHDVSEQRIGNDAMAVREVIDERDGCEPFALSAVRVVRGRSFERATGADEELLFVLAGAGELIAGDEHVALVPETGVLLRPGARYELQNDDAAVDLELVSVLLRTPEAAPDGDGAGPRVSRLADAEEGEATGGRAFRIVFDAEHDCPTATEFVGYIPVGAAPRHYHLYEEVIWIVDGEGVMHMNDTQTRLHPGSCIHLPARKLHTLENSGPGVMRVLGVFRPAGSPAAAFYPDGTPAYTADESQPAAAQ
jgi:mannose-6-phosphate isomerase-like protein (cupin superfamily)